MLYINEPQALISDTRYFFLESIPSKFAWEQLNYPIHVNFKILEIAAASAVESETGVCFITGRDVRILRNTLE